MSSSLSLSIRLSYSFCPVMPGMSLPALTNTEASALVMSYTMEGRISGRLTKAYRWGTQPDAPFRVSTRQLSPCSSRMRKASPAFSSAVLSVPPAVAVRLSGTDAYPVAPASGSSNWLSVLPVRLAFTHSTPVTGSVTASSGGGGGAAVPVVAGVCAREDASPSAGAAGVQPPSIAIRPAAVSKPAASRRLRVMKSRPFRRPAPVLRCRRGIGFRPTCTRCGADRPASAWRNGRTQNR